jgi:hypothetical protein
MDILTLELFDVTVSAALREIDRAMAANPGLPLRILLGADANLQHNVLRRLERLGRPGVARPEGGGWRLDVPGQAPAAVAPWPAAAVPAPAAEPAPAPTTEPVPPPAAVPPLLLTRAHLGAGGRDSGRRLLLGILRELDPAVPWVGLALDAVELLDDPQALALLEAIQARGVPVRISRESQLFPQESSAFEIMEDSFWQRLAGRGGLTLV